MENEDWFVDCKDTHSYRIGTQEETKETIKLRIDLVKHKRLEHKEKEKIEKKWRKIKQKQKQKQNKKQSKKQNKNKSKARKKQANRTKDTKQNK